MISVHLENGLVTVRDIPRPERPEGFALIRLICAGICNTDLELQRGYYAFIGIPGHEFVGEVVEADKETLIGKRVVGEINLGCNQCNFCLSMMSRHCATRTVLGIVKHPGAFAEYLTLPERNLHIVPASIATDEAVFIEPLAAARRILDQVGIPHASRVAVLGDGKLGLLIAQVLHAHGARVAHYGRHPEKLAISRDAGIDIVNGTPKPSSFNYVVDATGSPEGLQQAVAATRATGILIMKSTVHGLVPVDTAPIIVNELVLVGSRCGRFQPAIELLEQRKVNVKPLLADRFPLHRAPEAFARAAEKGVLKVLLDAEAR